MKRLKAQHFYALSLAIFLLLTALRLALPKLAPRHAPEGEPTQEQAPSEQPPHPILSVPSYREAFPDLQDTHLQAALRLGVPPVRDRQEAEALRAQDGAPKLVYVGASPLYAIAPRMTASIPYLEPTASRQLATLASSYLDSLAAKGVPLHKLIVSSALRTEADVARLVKRNRNASLQSCHRYGTTFDVCYNRYETVSPPGEQRRPVANDTLKWVLSEVLRDLRAQGLCYVKYEVKQGCFHITAR